jgi:hypothetical protein
MIGHNGGPPLGAVEVKDYEDWHEPYLAAWNRGQGKEPSNTAMSRIILILVLYAAAMIFVVGGAAYVASSW